MHRPVVIILNDGRALARTSDGERVKGPLRSVLHALVWLDNIDPQGGFSAEVVRA